MITWYVQHNAPLLFLVSLSLQRIIIVNINILLTIITVHLLQHFFCAKHFRVLLKLVHTTPELDILRFLLKKLKLREFKDLSINQVVN